MSKPRLKNLRCTALSLLLVSVLPTAQAGCSLLVTPSVLDFGQINQHAAGGAQQFSLDARQAQVSITCPSPQRISLTLLATEFHQAFAFGDYRSEVQLSDLRLDEQRVAFDYHSAGSITAENPGQSLKLQPNSQLRTRQAGQHLQLVLTVTPLVNASIFSARDEQRIENTVQLLAGGE